MNPIKLPLHRLRLRKTLDINLKGKIDGIEASAIFQQKKIPVIFLTANSDDATFNRAKQTQPAAFITKPFKQLDLQRAIELTISRLGAAGEEPISNGTAGEEKPFMLSDRIFVRSSERMIKIMMMDIVYVEADRNYSRIFTKEKVGSGMRAQLMHRMQNL